MSCYDLQQEKQVLQNFIQEADYALHEAEQKMDDSAKGVVSTTGEAIFTGFALNLARMIFGSKDVDEYGNVNPNTADRLINAADALSGGKMIYDYGRHIIGASSAGMEINRIRQSRNDAQDRLNEIIAEMHRLGC